MEATLKDVTIEGVPPVEPRRVAAVQPLHSARDVRYGRLEREMEVIVHEAVRVASPAVAANDLRE